MTDNNTDVIVIGGGYAGVLAANRLTQRDDATVTLINPRPAFVDRIRLHQRVSGTHGAVFDYPDVLAERVRLVVDTVTGIDADACRVQLATGGTAAYDYVIYAVGSGSADPGVPGVAEYAYPVATLEDADRLKPVLDAARETAPVTVVGAGPLGIETAAELAEQGRTVTLICGGVLGPYLHPRGRRSVADRLAGLGVAVVAGPDTMVTAVTGSTVQLGDGRVLSSDTTIWAAGFGVPDLARRSGLTTDTVGRLLTDETLTSVDDVRVVAAGDSAAPSGLPFRMSCQAAVQLAPSAADTVLSRIRGERPAAIAVGLAAQCISLGRRAGVFQFARRSDTAVGVHLGGRTGAKVKEIVCSRIIVMLANEARKPGSLNWPAWLRDKSRQRFLESAPDQTPRPALSGTPGQGDSR